MITDEQMRKRWEELFSTNNPFCPCDFGTFKKVARAIEQLVRADAEQTSQVRIVGLEQALQSVAADILRNDDGAIVDTLWHGNAETVIDFIGNTLGRDVSELQSQPSTERKE